MHPLETFPFIKYLLLSFAIFFSICIVSYLIHLNDRYPNEAAPVANEIFDVVVYGLFAAYWSFVIFLFR